jgi:hypothetical protein
MRNISLALALVVGVWMIGVVTIAGAHTVKVLDDCDPTDTNWNPIGGCALQEGEVTRAEFDELLPPGHPAWWNDPPYLTIEPTATVNVQNQGGRRHTFTEVEEFAGGFNTGINAALNLTPAPECLNQALVNASNLPAGAHLQVTGLSVGNHLFQCCIHPWMRTLIKVLPDD